MFGRRKTASPNGQAPAAKASTGPKHRRGRETEARVNAALADLERRRAIGTDVAANAAPATPSPSAPSSTGPFGEAPAEPAGARPAPVQAQPPAGFHALSHWFAAGGRMDQAALALWAHDVRAMRPKLGVGAIGLLDQVASEAADDPYGTLDRARVRALDALFANGVRTAEIPELVSSTHISNVTSPGRALGLPVGTYEDLRATADHLMRRAELAPEGPESARRDARRSDLAALDAVLVASATRAGDCSGATIELRRALANQALAVLEPRLRNLPLVGEVRQVRIALRQVVEPHEVADLNAAFAAEPS